MTQPSPAALAAAALLAALAAVPLGAQTGPCGVGNVRNWCVHEDSPGVAGVAQANDLFGSALAFGDFDGDGARDLAVGAPGEADGLANNAGAVWVFYASSAGLHAAGEQVLDQDSLPGDDGGTETGDRFGYALAAADFDGDGFDDLAIGSPYEAYFLDASCGEAMFCENGGLVHVVFGSATGLAPSSAVLLDYEIVHPVMGSFARIGIALAAGHLDGDGFADLVIGTPGIQNEFVLPQRGGVIVLKGSADRSFSNGSSVSRAVPESFDQVGEAVGFGRFTGTSAAKAVGGCPRCDPAGSGNAGAIVVAIDDEHVQTDFGTAGNGADDHFGAALAVGDFDGDGRDDLAIGAPEKNDSSTEDSGRVYIAYGSATGPDPDDYQIFRVASFPSSTPAVGDRFGAALAAGDYDGDGRDDLFIGSPGRGSDDRGFVYFLHGTAAGLAVGAGFVFSEPFLQGSFQEDAHFGSVLAMGDLDGDGTDEVAIGVPDKDIGGPNDAGLVYVTRALDPHWVFGDGFESGGVALWSTEAP